MIFLDITRMVFRVPSSFDSFIPPPGQHDDRQPHPWRGLLQVTGMRNSDRGSTTQIRVSAVETDGENRVELWPQQFNVHVLHDRPVLRDVATWVNQNGQATCSLMPQRLRNANMNTVNQSTFRALSGFLAEHHLVAVAPWGTGAFSGAGIIIYPAPNSSAYLIGALFHFSEFPDFVNAGHQTMGPLPTPPIPPVLPQYTSLGQSPSYPPQPQYRHPHSVSPHRSHPNSPVDQPIAGGSGYRFIMPRTNMPSTSAYPNPGSGSGHSPTNPTEGTYTTFPPRHEDPPYP